MKIRLATRGSKLSLAQTEIVIQELRKVRNDIEVEVVIVKTRGDIHQDKPLQHIGGKGLFEREVNLAVIEGRADAAVHSLKDVPSEVHPNLVLAMTPPRGPMGDVLVSRGRAKSIWDLPHGAVVGTSSSRRASMLKSVRSDLVIKPIRGNVDTRLRKLVSGEYDAIVLARAGLERLKPSLDVGYWDIPVDILPPAPGQGIIGVYTLYSSTAIIELLSKASNNKTMVQARAERAFLAYAGGGCHVPLGGYAEVKGGSIFFRASMASPDGSKRVNIEVEGDADMPTQVGIDAALELRARAKERGII
ncbi:MAG: hydroxymethylbilane synthase [Thermoproteota archaeon]